MVGAKKKKGAPRLGPADTYDRRANANPRVWGAVSVKQAEEAASAPNAAKA